MTYTLYIRKKKFPHVCLGYWLFVSLYIFFFDEGHFLSAILEDTFCRIHVLALLNLNFWAWHFRDQGNSILRNEEIWCLNQYLICHTKWIKKEIPMSFNLKYLPALNWSIWLETNKWLHTQYKIRRWENGSNWNERTAWQNHMDLRTSIFIRAWYSWSYNKQISNITIL